MTNGEQNLEPGETSPSTVKWPKAINDEGMYGIAGEFVRMALPETEADPNIMLLAFLTYAGNLLGREYYTIAGSDRHCGNLFLCPVGGTGHGRKGSAISAVEAFFLLGGSAPKGGHMLYGISTGEGLIWEVHDEITKREYNKKTREYETVGLEENIPDKRLMIYLSEFHQCIAAMRRQDSILSSVFRQAWDKDILSTPTKTSPTKATGAHISMIGCITKDELLRQTTAGDAENGTLNRFMFPLSRRSKLMPEGGKFDELIYSPKWRELQERLQKNIENAAGASIRFKRDDDASDEWGSNQKPRQGMYGKLSQARAGLWGAVTTRAAQQVIRLSLITAAINGRREIRREHLLAAYEQWRYCDESAKYIFSAIDDPVANRIMAALEMAATENGMTRTQINNIWNGKKRTNEINAALTALAHSGIVRMEIEETGGRPVERWFAI